MAFSAPRISIAISAHGFGHLTQTAAVLQALANRYPNMALRIQCHLEHGLITERLGWQDFEHEKIAMDVGLVQHDPLTVDLSSSLEAYTAFHDNFDEKIEREGQKLKSWGADMVLSDISYLALAAADYAGIPGIALASLSWDHIVEAYFDLDSHVVSSFYQQIKQAYGLSTLALLPEPALDGGSFKHVRPIPPVFIPGEKKVNIRNELGLDQDDKRPLVLCSLGGVASSQIPLESMQQQEDFHWLIHVNRALPEADNLHTIKQMAHWPYKHIIASVDAVVGKPGYGMAVEVVVHDLPFVYTRRGHFPDELVISAWLDRHARSVEITNAEWLAGKFTRPLTELWASHKKPHLTCNGAEVAARIMSEFL